MEATLTQSSNKRTLIVTLGSVLATVVVFGGVFLGPNIVQCVQSADGFGACLRDALVERGLVDTDGQDLVAQGEQDAPGPEGTTDRVENVVAEAAGEADNPPIGARVEPNGSVILVGTAGANMEVQLFANGEPLGRTTTDSVGDWIFIPDNPIAPGGVEITMGTVESAGELALSDDRLVVVIQEDLQSEPLVVAGKAGETSDILQDLFGPDANVPALDTSAIEVAETTSPDEEATVEPPLEVAALESAPEIPAVEERAPLLPEPGTSQQTDSQSIPEITTQDAAPEATSEPETVKQETATEPAPEAIVSEPTSTEDEAVQEAATEQLAIKDTTTEQQGDAPSTLSEATVGEATVEEPATAPTQEPANEPVSDTQVSAEVTPQSAEAEPVPVVPVPAEAEQVDQQPADSANDEPLAQDAPLEVAAINPEQLIVETPAAFVPPSIDAVEIEAGRNYIAGGGQNGATVRLYVDNVHVGDSIVQGGRWLVEAENILTKPSQRIRADMLVADTGQVAARSEINFVIEKPEPAPVVVAEVPAPEEAPDFTLPADQLAPISLPTEAPAIVIAQIEQATPGAEQPVPVADFLLSAEQLAPAVLPTSAPPVGAPPVAIAEAPAPVVVAQAPEPAPEEAPDFTLPADQLAPISLPTEAPAIVVAEVEQTAPGAEQPTPSPTQVVDFVLSAEQLAPAVLPTSAPPVGAPPVAIAEAPAPVVVAQAPEPVPEEASDFTLPADQLAPISLPTEAPTIIVAEVEQALAVEAPSETGDENIPTLVAVAVGDPEDQRFVSGKAIIRRGDNLWTIARRVYGTGVSYTMIFDANKSQIRDPDLIYPGQVFDLPQNSQE